MNWPIIGAVIVAAYRDLEATRISHASTRLKTYTRNLTAVALSRTMAVHQDACVKVWDFAARGYRNCLAALINLSKCYTIISISLQQHRELEGTRLEISHYRFGRSHWQL